MKSLLEKSPPLAMNKVSLNSVLASAPVPADNDNGIVKDKSYYVSESDAKGNSTKNVIVLKDYNSSPKSIENGGEMIDEDVTIDFQQETTPKDVVTVIATQPLTNDENWHKMATGEFIVFHFGEPVFNQLVVEGK